MKFIFLKDPPSATARIPQYNYRAVIPPREIETRSQDGADCMCTVCTVGRLNGLSYTAYAKTMVEPVGRPSQNEVKLVETVKLCDYCFSEIGKGKPHTCNKSTKQDNLLQLVRSNSNKAKEQVASSLLKEIYETKNISTSGGITTKIATKGTPLQVTVGQDNNNNHSAKFTLEDMTKLQISRNLTDKDTLAVANFIRVKAGRHAVEKNLKNHLADRNSKLGEMFYQKEMNLKEKPKKKKKDESGSECGGKENFKKEETTNQNLDGDGYRDINRPGIFVKDVKGFTQMVVEERGLDPENLVIQFGFDDGQGLLKLMQIVKGVEIIDDSEKKKRAKYSDGVCTTTSKLSSVKKLFIIGLVPNVSELYPNIKAILNEVNLEGVDSGISADIKIYLVMLGKQSASCIHSCPYCEGQAPWLKKSSPLTIGSLNAWHLKYMESGAAKKDAQHYQNVVNKPLIVGDVSKKIVEILNIPELHCLTGTVGKIVTEMERIGFNSKEEGEKFVNDFLKVENIHKCVYQGSNSFEGNQARKLLKKVKELKEAVMVLDNELTIQKTLPFVETLRRFDKVVDACFGQKLDRHYQADITSFSQQYRSLNISITPKVILDKKLCTHLTIFF